MNTPDVLGPVLDQFGRNLTNLRQSKPPGHIDLFCSVDQGRFKINLRYVECQTFEMRPEDLAGWNSRFLGRQREQLDTEQKVIELISSALFETWTRQQGHAQITVAYRIDGHFGLCFAPSIVLGFNPHR
jgi:hypothetical protein